MNYISQIESSLRDLAHHTRTTDNNNNLNQTIELALLSLRKCKSNYLAELRQHSSMQTVDLAKIIAHPELIAPYISALQHSTNVETINLALDGLLYLLTFHAIVLEEELIRVLLVCSKNLVLNGNSSKNHLNLNHLAGKILQLCVGIVVHRLSNDNDNNNNEELMTQCFLLCFVYLLKDDGKNNHVHQAAKLSLQQIILSTFQHSNNNRSSSITSVIDDIDNNHLAYKLVEDLVNLSELHNHHQLSELQRRGPLTTAILLNQGGNLIKRSECIELLELIVRDNVKLFGSTSLSHLLKVKICPLTTSIIFEFSGKLSYSNVEELNLSISIINLAGTIVYNYSYAPLPISNNCDLADECYVLCHCLVRSVIDSVNSVQVSPVLSHSAPKNNANYLWTAALAVDRLYLIISNSNLILRLSLYNSQYNGQNNNHNNSTDVENRSIALLLSNALVKYIQYLVNVTNRSTVIQQCIVEMNTEVAFESKIYLLARTATKSFEEHTTTDGASHSQTQAIDAINITSVNSGAVLLTAIQCIFGLINSLYTLAMNDNDDPEWVYLINCITEPCLTGLQFLISKFTGSIEMLQLCIDTLFVLFSVTLRDVETFESQSVAQHRRDILLVIGEIIVNLQTHNARSNDAALLALAKLFEFTHLNSADFDKADWHIIFEVFDRVSLVNIRGFQVSNEKVVQLYKSHVGECFKRLVPFTTSFNNATLKNVVSVLLELSVANNGTRTNDECQIDSEEEEEDTADSSKLTNRLIGFAGRAWAGASHVIWAENSQNHEQIPNMSNSPKNTSNKYLPTEALCSKLYELVVDLECKSAIIADSSSFDLRESFFLACFVGILLQNSERIDCLWEIVSSFVLQSCISLERSLDQQSFLINLLGGIILSALEDEETPDSSVIHVIYVQKNLENVGSAVDIESIFCLTDVPLVKTSTRVNDKILLTPLKDILVKVESSDLALIGVQHLYQVLERVGYRLGSSSWFPIIESISSLSGLDGQRSCMKWKDCVEVSFNCLKMVVDNFLDQIPIEKNITGNDKDLRVLLLDACSKFALATHDVNISFSTTGMLWTLADLDPTPEFVQIVMNKLNELACDERTAVRDCAINTLISCVIGQGSSFSNEQWVSCLRGSVFVIIAQIYEKIYNSRILPKDWVATAVLVLRGLERVFRQYFKFIIEALAASCGKSCEEGDELKSKSWIVDSWSWLLDTLRKNITELDTKDIQQASSDLIILCCQLNSSAGLVKHAVAARVGTSMQVVDGALRNVENKSPAKTKSTNEVDDFLLSAEAMHLKEDLFQLSYLSVENLISFYIPNCKSPLSYEDLRQFNIIEDDNVQMVSRLTLGLSNLYECCREDELSEGRDLLQKYFVPLIARLSLVISPGPSSIRYLHQGQKTSLKVLSRLARAGSSLALSSLCYLSDGAFLNEGKAAIDDQNDDFCSEDEDESTDDEAVQYIASTLLSREAGKELSKITISSDGETSCISPNEKLRCCVFILQSLVNSIESKYDENVSVEKIIPVFTAAISSMRSISISVRESDDAWITIEHLVCSIIQSEAITVNNVGAMCTFIPSVIESLPNDHVSAVQRAMSRAIECFLRENNATGTIPIICLYIDSMLILDQTTKSDSTERYQVIKNFLSQAVTGDEFATEVSIRLLSECAHIKTSRQCLASIFPIVHDIALNSNQVLNENNDLRSKCASLLSGMDLVTEMNAAKQRAEKAENEIVNLQQRLKELEAEVARLKVDNHKLQEEVIGLGSSASFY